MSRKAKFDELGWFSIENYRVFSNITVEEMLNEILIRYKLMVNLKAAKASELDSNNPILISSERQYNRIIGGDPRLYEYNEEWSNQEVSHFKRKNTIKQTNLEKNSAYIEYQTNAVRLLRGEDIQRCYLQMLERMSGMLVQGGYGPMDTVKEKDVVASHNIPAPGILSIAVNLESDDEDILEEIKSSLRFWRAEYHECRYCMVCRECHDCHQCHKCSSDSEECKKYDACMKQTAINKKALFTDVSLLSIFDNHILAVMDLYLWAFNNQATISISDFDRKINNYPKGKKSYVNPEAFKKSYLSKARIFLDMEEGSAYDFFDDFIHRLHATPDIVSKTAKELKKLVESYRQEKSAKRITKKMSGHDADFL